MTPRRGATLRTLGTASVAARGLTPGRLLDQAVPRVQVRAAGTELLATAHAPVLFASNHASPLDAAFIAQVAPLHLGLSRLRAAVALPLGRSAVVFPELGPTPNGSLGQFHESALAPGRRHGVPVVPVAIRGSFGLDEHLTRWHVTSVPTVLVRFGAPVLNPGAEQVRDAVAALLSEDAGTWWESISGAERATDDAGDMATAEAQGWLTAWRDLGPLERPGENRRPRIWTP